MIALRVASHWARDVCEQSVILEMKKQVYGEATDRGTRTKNSGRHQCCSEQFFAKTAKDISFGL